MDWMTWTLLAFGFFKRKGKQESDLPEPEEEELEPHNPEGDSCPKCKGKDLIVAEDHSAYCLDCQMGFMNVREPGGGKPSEHKEVITREKA